MFIDLHTVNNIRKRPQSRQIITVWMHLDSKMKKQQTKILQLELTYDTIFRQTQTTIEDNKSLCEGQSSRAHKSDSKDS